MQAFSEEMDGHMKGLGKVLKTTPQHAPVLEVNESPMHDQWDQYDPWEGNSGTRIASHGGSAGTLRRCPLEPMQHTVSGGAGAREPPSESRTGTTADKAADDTLSRITCSAKAVPTKFQFDTPPQSPPGLERTPEQAMTVRRNAEENLKFLFDSPKMLQTLLGIDIDTTVRA